MSPRNVARAASPFDPVRVGAKSAARSAITAGISSLLLDRVFRMTERQEAPDSLVLGAAISRGR
jgi:hypothetical protein